MIDASGYDDGKIERAFVQPCAICQGDHLALNCGKQKVSVWDGAAFQEIVEDSE